MFEKLVNKGIVRIGGNSRLNTPIIVIGTARGGTSMIAGVLSKMGFFLGDAAVAPVYEDTQLAAAFEGRDDEAVKKIAQLYSAKHANWAWKRPSIIDDLNRVDKLFDQPRYVFIFKDLLSIANRNVISMNSDLLKNMERALLQYMAVLQFLRTKRPDALLISYDKAMAYKKYFIESLADYCNIQITNQTADMAINFMEEEPSSYLDASRITKAHGRIDKAQGKVIAGWARYTYSREPAVVDIYVNDCIRERIVALNERADLIKHFGQPCGFKLVLSEKLKAGDLVRARVKGDIRDLANSPILITE